MRSDIIITTTSSIENEKIEKYLKPISAHVVAGTNLFSDWGAGFTDIFGGRSSTYQKQLKSIYDEVIKKMKNEAAQLGADALVGLKIDIDEISGKGKAMFMITAIGTPVIIVKASSNDRVLSKSNNVVSINEINDFITLSKLHEKLPEKGYELDESLSGFIIESRNASLFYGLTKYYNNRAATYKMDNDRYLKFYAFIQEYLLRINENTRNDIIYECLEKLTDVEEIELVISLINAMNLLDITKLNDALKAVDFTSKKLLLKLINSNKELYTTEDIELISQLITTIENIFTQRGEIHSAKSFLGKIKDVWKCECKQDGNDLSSYCSNCGKDIYGFFPSDFKPKNAVDKLIEKRDLIQELFELKLN